MPGPACSDAAGRRSETRPTAELADVIRLYGEDYRRAHRVPASHDKVLRAIEACRTALLGGRLERCDHCGRDVHLYNSCRNRHCPKCGALAKAEWLQARQGELLPVPYFHNTFTVPHELNPLILCNKKVMLAILFRAVSDTLLQFARQRGGVIGVTAVLHTWSQQLDAHFHIHCLIPGGMLSLDRTRWLPVKPTFLFPVRALSVVFRGKFLDYLEEAYSGGQLIFPGKTAPLAAPDAFARLLRLVNGKRKKWVVDSRPPFAGPGTVLDYLARYTQRIAISNDRIVDINGGKVTFKYRDRRRNNVSKTCALGAEEFIRRFLLHVLPDGFHRIRHYGLLANRSKKDNLARCRDLLNAPLPPEPAPESTSEIILRMTGIDVTQCPHCGKGTLHFVRSLLPVSAVVPSLSPFTTEVYDTA